MLKFIFAEIDGDQIRKQLKHCVHILQLITNELDLSDGEALRSVAKAAQTCELLAIQFFLVNANFI